MRTLTVSLIFSLGLTLAPLGHSQDLGIRDLYIGQIPESMALATFGEAKEFEFKRAPIKVLVWNIKKAQMKDWEKEFLAYSKDRDLILLQEATRHSLFDRTISAFKNFRWDMGMTFFYRLKGFATGTMIGSRVEPRETFVRHSPDVEPVTKTPKSFTVAKYPIEGSREELLVISVHAINLTPARTFRRHVDMAHHEIGRHRGPVLYAGDFNTWTEKRLKYLYDSTKRLGLTTVQFKNGHLRMSFSDNYLDHGFVRGLNVVNAEVLSESKGSDHRPLLIEVSFPK